MNADSFAPAAMTTDRRQLRWLTRLAIATIAALAGLLHAGITDANAAFLANTPPVQGADNIWGSVKMSNECWHYGNHCSGHQVFIFACSYYSRPGIYAQNRTGKFYPTGWGEWIGPACGSGALAGAYSGATLYGTTRVIENRYCVGGGCWRSRP
jgi:hypothetical protein